MEDQIVGLQGTATGIIPNHPDLWLSIDTFRRASGLEITPELAKHLNEMITGVYHSGWRDAEQESRDNWYGRDYTFS